MTTLPAPTTVSWPMLTPGQQRCSSWEDGKHLPGQVALQSPESSRERCSLKRGAVQAGVVGAVLLPAGPDDP
jgi:hypothetical protein